jgi:putative tricarboxylic transport membrane protein
VDYTTGRHRTIEVFMTILFATLLGSFFGILAGIIPGVGMFVTVAVMYPWLLDWSPAAVIMFYTALISSSQYFGSITAIYLGIGGESSSFPAVIEGPTLSANGQGAKAIWLTGFGSFVGTFVGMIVMMLAITIGASYILTTTQTMILFAIVSLLLFTLSKNSWPINVFMLIFALAISHLGVSANDSVPLISFGQPWLSSGVSFFALAAGLICMKEIFAVSASNSCIYNKNQLPYSLWSSAWHAKNSILRGSIFGSIGGLVPGITTVASSHLSYAIEKIVHKKTYKKGHMPSIVSSETANNSGSITQLIPLLLLGIPITGSETIIYNILDSKGWAGLDAPWELFLQHWWLLLIVNLTVLLIAVKFSGTVIKLLPSNQTAISFVVFFLLAVSVYWIGTTQTSSGVFDLIIFLLSVAVAYTWPKINWLPFVFCVVVGDIWLEQAYRSYQLTFG